MNQPLFSIIIPTYNRAHLIGKTIQSVLEQTYSNFEVIIVDDGGTDNTKEVVNGFNDNRLQYYWKENGERGAARNFGAFKSKGNYLNFVDSDDTLYGNHLFEAEKIITSYYHEIFCLNFDVKSLDGKLERVGKNIASPINKSLLKGNCISMNSVFVQKNIFENVKFNEDINFIGGEDWLLWLKLSVRYNFLFYNIISSTIVEHDQRSVYDFNKISYDYRTNKLITELKNDTPFLTRYNQYIPKIHAHMLSYTALHAALANKKGLAIKYLIKAGFKNPAECFTRRTLGIVKNILF